MLDLLISDALVVDGSGAPAYAADVGVAGHRVVLIRRAGDGPRTAADRPAAARTVDAAGCVLAPGFIDVHTHSDLAPFTDPWMDSALRQGVTTVVVGNCGASAWPRAGLTDLATSLRTTVDELAGGWGSAAEYLAAVDAARPACNVAALAGFGSLRSEVMGHERRPATPAETEAMRRLLTEAMRAGALGLSAGLIYVPDMYASTDEVAAVATAAAPFGGIYTTHMRAEGKLLFRAVRERSRSDEGPGCTRISATSSSRAASSGVAPTSSSTSSSPAAPRPTSTPTLRGRPTCLPSSPPGRRWTGSRR